METKIEQQRLAGAYWIFVGYKSDDVDNWIDLDEAVTYIIRKVKTAYEVHQFKSFRFRGKSTEPMELNILKTRYETEQNAIDAIMLRVSAEAI